MALTTEQKIGVNANFDRTTLDTYKDADGDPLKSAVVGISRQVDDWDVVLEANSFAGLGAVHGGGHLETGQPKAAFQGRQHIGVVVHDQDARGGRIHESHSAGSTPGRVGGMAVT